MSKKKIIYLVSLCLTLIIFLVLFILILNASSPLAVDYAVRDLFYNIRGNKYNFIYYFFRIITELGNTYFIIALLIFSLFLFRLDNRFFIIVFSTIFMLVLQLGLKEFVNRERPTESLRWVYESTSSFPSGHSMASGLILTYYSYMIYEAKYNKKTKKILITIISILYLLVLISRLVFGVHYFSDVVAGFSLGTLIALLSVGVHIFFNQKEILTFPLIFKKSEKWII